MTTKAIYLDLDGTLVDLYGVEGWLEMLEASDTTPYIEAKPMVRLANLARLLNLLQERGYHIAIVSWLSKGGTNEYNTAVMLAKYAWLNRHLPSVWFDEIKIIPYGTPKSRVVEHPEGILFDDEYRNQAEWKGLAFDATDLLETLRGLL